jgi:hypothetical protein
MYIPLDDTQQNRKRELQRAYFFDCNCEACSTSPNSHATKLSDERRSHIRDVLERLTVADSKPTTLAQIEKALKDSVLEQLVEYRGRLLSLGSYRVIQMALEQAGRANKLQYLRRGRDMMEEAVALSEMLQGKDTFYNRSLRAALAGRRGFGRVPEV